MRLNINLASQPYEVAREYKRRMTVLIAALSVVAIVLVGYIVYQRAHSRSINRQLAEVQRQIDALNHEESQARAILNKPANHVIADQSEFLNELFARKGMSWTHIFTVMEKIVPPQLHVVSMKPEYSKTNDLVLHVVVATDSRDRAVELVRNMEKSSHFRQSQVVAENVVANTSEQTASSGAIQFDIAAIYVPTAADVDDKPEAGAAPAGKTASPPTPAAAPVKRAAMAPGGNGAPPGGSLPPPAMAPHMNATQNQPVPPNLRGH
ncbi:MAG: PilN domain-containing protein [Candidatus Korobacteraceae bacterium]